jgi:hypothetical protein
MLVQLKQIMCSHLSQRVQLSDYTHHSRWVLRLMSMLFIHLLIQVLSLYLIPSMYPNPALISVRTWLRWTTTMDNGQVVTISKTVMVLTRLSHKWVIAMNLCSKMVQLPLLLLSSLSTMLLWVYKQMMRTW